ncbi:PAS domain S-box protein [Algihabitans albus]|uniref:PAS domain S-box protein n=1 Tax=Algihabitans albus TaxID=2164067 RepID=UPI0035D07AF0
MSHAFKHRISSPEAVDKPLRPRLSRNDAWVRDLLAAILFTALLIATLISLDAFERIYDFSREYEDWDLDEFIVAIASLGFASSWFAWRRWREVRHHLRARIAMERELHNTAEDRDFLISAAGGAFYGRNAGGDFAPLHVDSSIELLTGHRPQAFTEDSGFLQAIVHPDDRHRTCNELSQLSNRDYLEQEYRLRHADGTYRWMRDRLKLKRSADGTPGSIVGLWTDITEQKLAEQSLEAAVAAATEELQHREAHLRLITDNLPALIVYIDPEFRYQFVNQTGATWYGQSPKNLIGRPIEEVLGRESFNRLKPYLQGACEGRHSKFETSLTYPDGIKRHIQGLHVPDRDETGRVRGFVAMALDITDHKQTENELRAKQSQLELILNNIPTRIFYKDDQNRILRLNEPAARSIGLTVAQVEGADTYELFPETAEKYHKDDLEVLHSGKPKLGIVEEYIPRDGGHAWVRTDKVPYTDPETGKRFVFVAASDITAEKRAEERVRASEERFRSLYTKTPVMLHSIDADGRIISVSDFWLDKLGFSRDDVLGMKVTDLMTPESAHKAITEAVPEFLKKGVCRDLEYQIVTQSGEVLDILLSAVAEYEECGTFKRSMAVLTDITKRKAVERQLVQAQKMESVGQLTGGLAHDFNNLLGVVMGNLELLEFLVGENDEATLRIKAALDAVDRGAELNRRLLAFSRRQTLETRAVDPNPLIQGLSDLLTRTLGESIALECQLGDRIPHVRTDSNQLESTLLNLAVNARDAMPRGGKLTIETAHTHLDEDYALREQDVTPGDYVVLSVTDDGTGIPPDEVDKVFEPFFTTKEIGKGSGLGLSMVYGFMKQSGGHIRIYSEIGRGTTVRLYLPVAAPVVSNGEATGKMEHSVDGGSETVLVVEDHADVRRVAVSLLQNLGYTVLEATNGSEALLLLENHGDIDILFTDIVMPGGMDGTQVAKAARKLRPGLPVVYATGYAEAAVLRQGEVKAAKNLVTKPYRRDDLAHKLRQALGDKPPIRHDGTIASTGK